MGHFYDVTIPEQLCRFLQTAHALAPNSGQPSNACVPLTTTEKDHILVSEKCTSFPAIPTTSPRVISLGKALSVVHRFTFGLSDSKTTDVIILVISWLNPK